MWMICWSDKGVNDWIIIDGEDAMQEHVSDMVNQGISLEDIMVFDMNNEIDGMKCRQCGSKKVKLIDEGNTVFCYECSYEESVEDYNEANKD